MTGMLSVGMVSRNDIAGILDKVGIGDSGYGEDRNSGGLGGYEYMSGREHVETSACMSAMVTTLGLADGGHSENRSWQTFCVQ